jgi:hypothetical protein
MMPIRDSCGDQRKLVVERLRECVSRKVRDTTRIGTEIALRIGRK